MEENIAIECTTVQSKKVRSRAGDGAQGCSACPACARPWAWLLQLGGNKSVWKMTVTFTEVQNNNQM